MADDELSLGEMSHADEAFYGLVWAAAVLTEQVGRALSKAHDLSLSWFEVLLWLSAQPGPVSASALGNRTMLSRSQVSRVLDALRERGLVVRTLSARDARSVEVSLTDAGRALFAEADATRRACLAPMFTDVLGTNDLGALGAVWRRLKAHRAGNPN